MSGRFVLIMAAGLAVACSSGSPAGTSGPVDNPASSNPGAATPAGAPANTPGGQVNPPPAGGATTFHLVISDGPMAGTYDLTSTDPGACTNLDEGWWGANYDDFGGSGLTYIQAASKPTETGLGFAFDTGSDQQLRFVGMEEVTFEIDDQGSTAVFTIGSDTNLGTYQDFTTVDTGPVELTVQCAAVMRPNN
jgi:hypothetical protein